MIAQPPLLYLIPKITGSLSLIGSLYIIFDLVICDRKRKLDKSSITNRVVLCISISDVFASVSCWILGAWPVPKELNEFYDTSKFHGNTVTCTIQGFIYQWSVFSSAFYSTMLAVCYVLLVVGSCYTCCTRATSRRRNFFAHTSNKFQFSLLAIPLILSLLLAIAPLFDRAYNYNGTNCHISGASPFICVGDECENGKYSEIFLLANGICIILCFIIITVSMIVLFCFICRNERQSDTYVFRGSEGFSRTSNTSHTSQQKDSLPLSKRVAVQGLFYIGSFFLTWAFAFVVPIMGKPTPTWVECMFLTLLPMQGWFNALIYLRPKVVSYLKKKLKGGIHTKFLNCFSKTGKIMKLSSAWACRSTCCCWSITGIELETSSKSNQKIEKKASTMLKNGDNSPNYNIENNAIFTKSGIIASNKERTDKSNHLEYHDACESLLEKVVFLHDISDGGNKDDSFNENSSMEKKDGNLSKDNNNDDISASSRSFYKSYENQDRIIDEFVFQYDAGMYVKINPPKKVVDDNNEFLKNGHIQDSFNESGNERSISMKGNSNDQIHEQHKSPKNDNFVTINKSIQKTYNSSKYQFRSETSTDDEIFRHAQSLNKITGGSTRSEHEVIF